MVAHGVGDWAQVLGMEKISFDNKVQKEDLILEPKEAIPAPHLCAHVSVHMPTGMPPRMLPHMSPHIFHLQPGIEFKHVWFAFSSYPGRYPIRLYSYGLYRYGLVAPWPLLISAYIVMAYIVMASSYRSRYSYRPI